MSTGLPEPPEEDTESPEQDNDGYGREKGVEALAHYTQVKCVTVAL